MQTFAKLAEVENIVGVKQAVDSASELVELAQILDGTNVSIFAGDDPIVYSVMCVGGKGVISASANVIPEKFVELVSAAEQGNMSRALEVQQEILPIIRALFLETNPAPAKAALEMMGKIPGSSLRLPLVAASVSTRDQLKKVLKLP
jgi:4-hydroxy-tetrahydrodipicolinate synthase